MPPQAERFRLGVNYWPAATAMGWLAHYDSDVVRRDFRRIASAGMDTARIFVLWEDVQPRSGTIDPVTVSRVIDAADAATDAGIELIVTLFTGHMSGVNWIPPWALGGADGDARFRVVSGGAVQSQACGLRNWYGDAGIVDAQADLAGTLATALSGHPALWAWDLGNENSNCTIPPDASSGERWLRRMTTALRTGDPGRAITVGIHMEDLETDRIIDPAMAAKWCDFVCMHGYPAYADWAEGPTDEDLVPFLAEITRWLAGDAPVLFEEFGQPTVRSPNEATGYQVPEAVAASYTARTIDALWQAGSIGALLWCFSDYSPDLYGAPPLDCAPHERSFGLWRADQTPKPVVTEIRSRRGRTRAMPGARDAWLDVTTAEFLSDRRTHLIRLYRRFRVRGQAGR